MPDQMYQGQLPQGAMPPQQMGPNATPQQMGFPMYAQAGMPQQHLQQHPQQHPQQQFGYQMPAMQHPPSQPMQPQRHTFTLKSVDAPVFVPRGMQAAPAVSDIVMKLCSLAYNNIPSEWGAKHGNASSTLDCQPGSHDAAETGNLCPDL